MARDDSHLDPTDRLHAVIVRALAGVGIDCEALPERALATVERFTRFDWEIAEALAGVHESSARGAVVERFAFDCHQRERAA